LTRTSSGIPSIRKRPENSADPEPLWLSWSTSTRTRSAAAPRLFGWVGLAYVGRRHRAEIDRQGDLFAGVEPAH
jgi:hypothetical protein